MNTTQKVFLYSSASVVILLILFLALLFFNVPQTIILYVALIPAFVALIAFIINERSGR